MGKRSVNVLRGMSTRFKAKGMGGGNANNSIQGFTGGIAGQILYLCKTGSTNTLTLEDHEGVSGVQNICCVDAQDYTFAAGSGGAVLVCDGTNWNVVSITGSVGSTNPA